MLDKSIQIGIIGLGLIGGSIAKNLSKKGYKVYANDLDEESLINAFNEKKIDGFLEELDQNNPFILIFTIPVLSINKELLKNKELLSKALCITDGLSVKNPLKREIEEKRLNTENFILSHPIAGSEKSGYENSEENLFEEKIVVTTKLSGTSQTTEDICNDFWNLLGARTIQINSENHDKYFAKTSHLPHLIAFALMSMISKSKETKKEIFTGGGLKDFTRIASSDPKMWEDIFTSNKINMLEVIKSFKSELDQLEKLIKDSDAEKLNQFITNAKEFRDSLV